MAKIQEPDPKELVGVLEPWKILEGPLSQYFAELAEENGLEVIRNQRAPYEIPVAGREAHDPKSQTRLYLNLLLGKATEHYMKLEFKPSFPTRNLLDVLNGLGADHCTINGVYHPSEGGIITSSHIDSRTIGFHCETFHSEKIEQFGEYVPHLLKLARGE